MPYFPSPSLYQEYELFLKCREELYGPTPPTFDEWVGCRNSFIGPPGPIGPQGAPGPQGPAGPGASVLDPALLAREGRIFSSSTGDVPMPTSGPASLYLVLSNPAESNTLLQVIGIGANCQSFYSDLQVELNPPSATTSGFSPVPIQSTNSASPIASVASAISGVVDPAPSTPPGVTLNRWVREPWVVFNQPMPGTWVVPPDTSLAFFVYLFGSGVANSAGVVSLIWGEISIM